MNDYEEAIISVGGAIARYSNEKLFPCWGFGAKYSGEVQHIFQCGQSSSARDIDGIVDAYRSVFQTDLIMSGPTVISKVVQAAAARARNFKVSSFTHHDHSYFSIFAIIQKLTSFFLSTYQIVFL